LKLAAEVEEVCNWWAQVEGTEFAENERVIKNFSEEFLPLFDKSLGATSLKDFDYSKIKDHLEKQREARLNRPTEEKKKEMLERQQNDQIYKYCLFDLNVEKVSNCLVEPPGIFRGRGDHPHTGRLKSRIVPEFVSINIG